MIEINCINCKKNFTKKFDTEYSGSVTCLECGKEMLVTVIDNKLVSSRPYNVYKYAINTPYDLTL